MKKNPPQPAGEKLGIGGRTRHYDQIIGKTMKDSG
jgi:hypothetical protein